MGSFKEKFQLCVSAEGGHFGKLSRK